MSLRKTRNGNFAVLIPFVPSLIVVVFEGYDGDHDGIIRREDVTAMFQAMWAISCRIIETTIRSDEELFENEQAETTQGISYASANTLTNRRRRADNAYPLSATFSYPPPGLPDFYVPDTPEIQGDEVPDNFLPRPEETDNSPNMSDLLRNEEAIHLRNRTFEEMEKVIDEIFEGGLAETGINFEQFRELAVGPHGRALMGWIDMLRTVF